jgi:hypothetical protein
LDGAEQPTVYAVAADIAMNARPAKIARRSIGWFLASLVSVAFFAITS